MFYISSVDLSKDKIGITDTTDNVEEFYTQKDLVKFHDKGIKIIGSSYYNYKCTPTVIQRNICGRASDLRVLLDNWKKVHNSWNGEPVENYLASLRSGTIILVDCIYHGSSGSVTNDHLKLVKKKDDNWQMFAESNTCDEEIGDTHFAAWALDVYYCGARPTKLIIK